MSSSNDNDPIANLIETYHSLNATLIDELDSEPSALDFLRYVAANRPFVVRKAATDWKAVQRWNASYLKATMGDEQVRIAVTPLGNADAVVDVPGTGPMFVEPWETHELLSSFLDSLCSDADSSPSSATKDPTLPRNVKYAQPQNDSLRTEYSLLAPDVPSEIPFAALALRQHADAINIWLGNDRSVTALHKDNYENIYVQVRGRKRFVLLPPVEVACVDETPLVKGRYAPRGGELDEGADVATVPLDVVEDGDGSRIPFAVWDPDVPAENATAYSHLSRPLRVTLDEGDMLYLPAMWYHKVSQSRGEEGFVCAVNYWYDMDFAGGFWTGMNFVRDVVEKERTTRVQYGEMKLETS